MSTEKKTAADFTNCLVQSGDLEQGTDYTLSDGYPSCWILVDGISVYIQRLGGGEVEVCLLPEGDEAGEPIDTARATGRVPL